MKKLDKAKAYEKVLLSIAARLSVVGTEESLLDLDKEVSRYADDREQMEKLFVQPTAKERFAKLLETGEVSPGEAIQLLLDNVVLCIRGESRNEWRFWNRPANLEGLVKRYGELVALTKVNERRE